MPNIRNILVYTLDRDSLTVKWEIESTTEDLSQYTVSVWRSESSGGPYAQVSPEMNAQDVYEFQDRSVNLYSAWRDFYYRLRLTKTSAGTSVFYGSTDPRKVADGADPGGVVLEALPDLEAMEAIHRFDLVLREFSGRRVLVLTERTWGQRCPNCWDNLKRRSTKSNCLTCFDTTVAGGFYRPVEARCMKPPGNVTTQLTSMFEMQPNDQVMWFSSRPRLKPRDVIIDIDGKRWRVIAISRSEKGWALTRQMAQVRMITRDQIEYEIPVRQSDWDTNNLTAGALRQHIRATDIDSYYKAVQDLGLAGEEVFAEKSEIATNLEDSDAES